MSALKNKSELLAVLQQQKKPLRQALLFSLVIGLLALAPSFYMLEVYERVVNSRSVMTLLMLTAAVFLAYLIMRCWSGRAHGPCLRWVRQQILCCVPVCSVWCMCVIWHRVRSGKSI